MDITYFVEWFFDQVVNMFSWVYSTLDSITFSGTSLLKIAIFVTILVPLLSVLLTINKNSSVTSSRSGRVKDKKGKDDEE